MYEIINYAMVLLGQAFNIILYDEGIDMDFTQAILLRKSRRVYQNRDIPADKVRVLQNEIASLNNETGLNMQLIQDRQAFASILKNYGFFKNVPAYIVLAGNKNDPLLHEKLGYYGELLVLEATKLKLGTCWVGSSYDRSETKAVLSDDEQLVCVISIGIPSEKLSKREKAIDSVMHRKVKKLEDLYECDKTPPPDWFLNAMNAVLLAPSAQNKQPVKFFYKDDKITATTGEYKINDVDLGIAKCHFDLECKGNFSFKDQY